MGLTDLPSALNALTFFGAIAVYWWRKPEGSALLMLGVVAAGTGLHFVTDLVWDLNDHLGPDAEHVLMHVVALGVVAEGLFEVARPAPAPRAPATAKPAAPPAPPKK